MVGVEGVKMEASVAPPRPSANRVSTSRGPTAPNSCTAVYVFQGGEGEWGEVAAVMVVVVVEVVVGWA